jgi:hypothetical protein
MTKQVQLTELFTPNLERCFFSSFCIDDQWLYSVLPPVPTCIARPFEQNLSYPKHVRVVFPKMLKFGAMHIKLLVTNLNAAAVDSRRPTSSRYERQSD